jgi:hypothetical protein
MRSAMLRCVCELTVAPWLRGESQKIPPMTPMSPMLHDVADIADVADVA